ncbi:hypothetical protein ACLOJK_024241, partial [Asimina triloba]
MAPKNQAVSKPRHPSKHPREPEVPKLSWEVRDDAMQRRYIMLSKRPVIYTRYVDEETRHDTGAIVIGGLVSMIAMRLGVSLEDPVHTRVLGNDHLDLNTLVLMKLCRREEGKYVIINEADNYQPRPPIIVHEDIPVAANDSSTSQSPPPPTHSA